jgi:tungstate transport system permease protein
LEELWQGLVKAIQLVFTFDSEVVAVAGRSLWISATSSSISALICLFLGSLIHFNRFWGKRVLINIIQTFFSVPTVAVGLFVFVLFSRTGPLGGLDLMFTPAVMIIGQGLLIIPVMLGFIISALSGVDKALVDTTISLGANRFQMAITILREARFAVLAALIMGFSRAISEVGLSLMVGGNIRGYTRTITTAISLETSKGELELSIALGIILIFIALVINVVLNIIQQR